MSDEENGEEQETMFTCKKCPGVYFKEEEKDAHRLKHRRERSTRASARNVRKPGPRSKQKSPGRRAPSPTPSTATLFSVRQKTPPPEESTSQRTRKRKAEATYQKNSKKSKGKRETGG